MFKKTIFILIILVCVVLDIFFIKYIISPPKNTVSSGPNPIEGFNNQFESYKGQITGKSLLSLCGRLVANSSTYSCELDRVPAVKYKDEISIKYTACTEENLEEYRNELKNLRENIIDENATYVVSFNYDKTGIISTIIIK